MESSSELCVRLDICQQGLNPFQQKKKHKYHLNKRQSYHTSFDVAEKKTRSKAPKSSVVFVGPAKPSALVHIKPVKPSRKEADVLPIMKSPWHRRWR